MARRSRLSRRYEKRSTQTLILSVLGIAAILFLLVKYGIPLISNISFFAGQAIPQKESVNKQKEDDNYVAPPALDPLPQATKEQDLTISGTSLYGFRIVLYLNGVKENETNVKKDGTFEFDVSLSEGENIIKAKAIKNGNESDFSDSLTVNYKKSNPNLTIDNPHDGDNISGGSPITVSGKTDPGNTVTVDDFQAIIDSSGNWSYGLTLVGGGNDIKVIATDLAGNKTEKSIHVNYSP